ncbi:hypothetical protein ABVF61_30580 [Roseibium sp. HPY-6]|uniref:hypothetical protein n=1 Tax=Roseibium sp. HPY-6 TaxID=3229852 RepID=UPI00338E23C5
MRCGDGAATVLAGDVGPIAWMTAEGLEEAFAAKNAEQGTLETGASGHLRLMDASDIGTDLLQPNRSLSLKPGTYSIQAGYFNTETVMMIVRKLVKF